MASIEAERLLRHQRIHTAFALPLCLGQGFKLRVQGTYKSYGEHTL